MLQTNKKDNKKIEYIALYCRVATMNQQTDDLLMKAQKHRLLEWATQQGYTSDQVTIISDVGFSGQTLNRPGIQQILFGSPKYAVVAAVKCSRFCRDSALLDKFISLAEAQGTVLYSLDFPISLNQQHREMALVLDALLKGGAGE